VPVQVIERIAVQQQYRGALAADRRDDARARCLDLAAREILETRD